MILAFASFGVPLCLIETFVIWTTWILDICSFALWPLSNSFAYRPSCFYIWNWTAHLSFSNELLPISLNTSSVSKTPLISKWDQHADEIFRRDWLMKSWTPHHSPPRGEGCMQQSQGKKTLMKKYRNQGNSR